MTLLMVCKCFFTELPKKLRITSDEPFKKDNRYPKRIDLIPTALRQVNGFCIFCFVIIILIGEGSIGCIENIKKTYFV